MKKSSFFAFILVGGLLPLNSGFSFNNVSTDKSVRFADSNFSLGVNESSSADSANNFRLLNVRQIESIRRADIFAPRSAEVSASGRVINSPGSGISGALVTVIGNGKTYHGRTNPFGFFTVAGIEAGGTYIFQIRHKRYTFAPQIMNVSEDLVKLNFTAQP